VAILLHEIGHMIETAKGNWLLPNDGNSATLSQENTWRVIEICREQITRVSSNSFDQQWAKAHGPRPASAEVATISK
jgi:hypothetical protein